MENTYCKYTFLFLQIGVLIFTTFSFSLFLAHRVKYLGRRHRTWLKFLEQVLYLSYYLFTLHQTSMDGASGPSYRLKDLDSESGPRISDAG